MNLEEFLNSQETKLSVQELSQQLEVFENKLKAYDSIVKERDDIKNKLKKAMEENGIKKWETTGGIKITLIEDTPDKEVEEEYYDEDSFIAENPEFHSSYHNKLAEYKKTRKAIKCGKSGYVKITLPKE